jgi:hypothetical protein
MCRRKVAPWRVQTAREDKLMTVDVRLGRWLAFCVYPSAAWRLLPNRGRALLIGAYFAGAYALVLALLLAL